MANKKLCITKKDKNYFIESDDNSMYTLYAAVDEMPFKLIKELITEEIKNNNIPMDYHFNTFGIRIDNNNTLTVYHIFNIEDPSYYLTISMDNYWKALEEYEKLENLNWKKLTITYDGNQVHFDPEY